MSVTSIGVVTSTALYVIPTCLLPVADNSTRGLTSQSAGPTQAYADV